MVHTHFAYVVLGAVLCFFGGLLAKTVITNMKNKNYKKVPTPTFPEPVTGGHGKDLLDEKGKDKPQAV